MENIESCSKALTRQAEMCLYKRQGDMARDQKIMHENMQMYNRSTDQGLRNRNF